MSMTSPNVQELLEPGIRRNESFWILVIGTAISLAGDALYTLVIPLWILRTTGSSGAYAAVSGVSSAVTLLVSPFAGTFADRTDRRRVMVGADLARALIVLSLAALITRGLTQIWPVVAVVTLLSTASSFFSPAYAAALSGLVHPNDLTQALSAFQLLRQVTMLSGPAVAGLIVSRAGNSAALALDAATFLVSAGCVYAIRLRWAPRPPKERKAFWHDFSEGVSTLTGSSVLIRTVLLSAGVNLVGGFFVILLPVVAIRELHLTTTQFGLFNTINPAGVVLGMVALSLFGKRVGQRGRFMLWCMLLMGIANTLMGTTKVVGVFLGLLFVGGLTFGLGNVMFAGLYRELVPKEQQGRFFGMLSTLNQALVPVGIAIAGVLGDLMSPFIVLGIGGIVVVTLSMWGFTTPGLRDLK